MVKAASRPTRIQSVSRAVRLLMRIASAHGGCSAKECAEAVGLSSATTYHLLNTLVDEGLLAKDAGRRYYLGPAVGVLADAFEHDTAPAPYLLAPLNQLARTTGESCYLSGWRLGDITVLASVEGSHAVRVSELRRGYHGAAHARASGKVLLAFARPEVRKAYLDEHPLDPLTPRTIVSRESLDQELEQVRATGYAVDDEEFKEGVSCVSAPVLAAGVVIAALTLSAPAGRFRLQRESFVDALLTVARSASRDAAPAVASQARARRGGEALAV